MGDSVDIRMGGSAADVLREIDKVIQKEAQAEAGFGKMANAAQKVGQQTTSVGHAARAMGESATGSMKSFLAGTLASVASMQTLVNLMKEREAHEKAAGDKILAAEASMAKLAQVSQGDPAKMKRLTEAALQTRKEGGTASIAEAADLVFQLESSGSMKQRALYSELGGSGLVRDPATMARAAATISAAMGEKETGSDLAITSKAFAASAYSPATAESILEASAGSGGLASALKMRDEEVLAATAITSKAAGSAEQGGTQVNAFLKSLATKGGFQGTSIEDAVKKIESKGMNEKALTEWFGRIEGFKGYETLRQNMGTYQQAVKDVDKGGETNSTLSLLRMADTNPTLKAARQSRQAEGSLEVTTLEAGVADLRARTLNDSIQEQMYKEHYWAPTRMAMAGKMGVERLINGAEEFTSERGYGVPGVSTPDRSGMHEAASELKGAIQVMRQPSASQTILGHSDGDPKGH